MNNNNTQTTITPNLNNQAEEAVNKKFFDETLGSHLSEETVKKLKLSNEWKDDTVEPVKTATDQEKIEAYDKLQVQDLPEDWKLQLARLKELEKNQDNYLKNKEELEGWTNTFSDKKPNEVQAEIKQREEKYNQTESELQEKIKVLEKDFATSVQESQDILKNLGQKIAEQEKNLAEWKKTFGNQELEEAKEEWKWLNQRPDIPITEKEWLDDYARRKPLKISEAEKRELIKAQENVVECQDKIKEIRQSINHYLADELTKRYVLAKPVITPEQAREKIAELLEEVEKKWTNYLTNPGEDVVNQELKLHLKITDEEKKKQAYQILDWIKEAKNSKDYQQLFEQWNDGVKYNPDYDFDGGSLYLLGKWLEVKDSP